MVQNIEITVLLCVLCAVWSSQQLPTIDSINLHQEKNEVNHLTRLNLNNTTSFVRPGRPTKEKRTLTLGLGQIGYVNAFEKLLDFIYETIEGSIGQEEPYSCLHYLEKELIDNYQFLLEMINLISNTKQKKHYLDSHNSIIKSLKALKKYAWIGSHNERINFLKAAVDLEASLFLLYKDLVSNRQPSQEPREDVLMICELLYKDHQQEFVKCANSYLKLIESGSAVLAGVYQLENLYSKRDWDVTKTMIIRNHKQIETRIFLLAKTGNKSSDKVRNVMAKLMVKHQSLDNEKMADKLFDYLSYKYDTDCWLVIVYDDIEGSHNHWQSGYYHHVFKQGGKNALAISRTKQLPKTQKIPIDSLKNVNSIKESFETFCENNCDWDDARQLINHLFRIDVFAKSTLFAIDSSANVVKRVDPFLVPDCWWDTFHNEAKTFIVFAIEKQYFRIASEINDFRASQQSFDHTGLGHMGKADNVEKLVNFTYETIEDNNKQEIAYQLLHLIETELNADHQFLHEMTNLIIDPEQKQQYFDFIKDILKSLRALKNYAETGEKSERIKILETTGNLETFLLSGYKDTSNQPQPNQYYEKTRKQSERIKFLETAAHVKASIFSIYKDILRKPHQHNQKPREDILNICKTYSQCHQRAFVKCANSFFKLMETASAILAGFYQLEDYHSKHEWEVTKANLLRNHQQIETRISLLTKKCATPAHDSLRNEMAKLMVSHQSLDNKKMADKLFDYLSEKYQTKCWLVIVYDGIEGGHNHWQSGFYNYVFRQGGKNALVINRKKLSQKSQEAFNHSLTEGNSLTEAIKTSCEGQCDGDDAHQLVDRLSRNDVLAEYTIFAIDSSANVVKRVDPNFVPHYFDKLYFKAKAFVVFSIKNELTRIKIQTFDLRGHRLASGPSGCLRLQCSWKIIVIFLSMILNKLNTIIE